MIEASELMIGNYVTKNGIRFHATEIHANGLIKWTAEGKDAVATVDITGCVGIELTPVLLEKCGFDSFYNVAGSKLYIHSGIILEVNGLGGIEYGIVNTYQHIPQQHLIHVQYLHQIQNLIFALTGNKLEVNF